ncbi:MAG: hypothetical protein HY474_00445 [Candidatus Sungbacteria bacterium]|uniref:Uncharacterized protein n=1 Tax=Candidatus Sungiibacteriota bacterium TaxID=2750080 RepID=A0A932YXL5_9BACT|nr:hypothetical protein [Candidatus Sungbacteria bacterium]
MRACVEHLATEREVQIVLFSEGVLPEDELEAQALLAVLWHADRDPDAFNFPIENVRILNKVGFWPVGDPFVAVGAIHRRAELVEIG